MTQDEPNETTTTRTTTVWMPSNLHYSPRAIPLSPIAGLTRVVRRQRDIVPPTEEKDNDDEEWNDDGDHHLEEDDDDDYKVKQVLYSGTSTTRAAHPDKDRVVVPLPDRLFVPVLDKKTGTALGSLYLSERIFGHDDIRVDLITRTVQYQRNQARGKRTAITKTISQVSGSGRKVRQQKGTGQARAGHSRPPHWRGGAKAHGPKGSVQNYANCKLNKHTKRLALTHALSQKLKEGNFVLLQDLTLSTHRTKELQSLLHRWDIGGRGRRGRSSRRSKTAYVVDHYSSNDDGRDDAYRGVPVQLSVAAQNIYKIKVDNQLNLNVYDIVKHDVLLMTVEAVTALEARLDEKRLRY